MPPKAWNSAILPHLVVTTTLQATALVHEAYLRRGGGKTQPSWKSRGQFFKAAAECMRRILIDSARHKGSLKAGEGMRRVDFGNVEIAFTHAPEELMVLDEAVASLMLDPYGRTMGTECSVPPDH